MRHASEQYIFPYGFKRISPAKIQYYAVHNSRRPVLALEFSTVLSIYIICILSASNRLYSLGNVFVELEYLTFIWLASSYTSTTQFSQNGACESGCKINHN